MLRRLVLPPIVLSLLVSCGSPPRSDFGVGFRVFWESDPSRAYGSASSRPILIAVWSDRSLPKLKYGDYFDLPVYPADPDYASRMSAFMTDHAVAAGGNGLLGMSVNASREAAPEEGKFPVVLYHPGAEGTFDENSILFERLASHGYVVISSAYQSTDPQQLGNNIGSFEEQIADLTFLQHYGAALPFADPEKTVAIGHSIGAQILLQWIGQAASPLQALVSLDTTLEYSPEDFPMHRSLRDAFRQLRKPEIRVFLAASAERQPNFATFDAYLRNSARYEVAVRGLTHGDYLTQGVVQRNNSELRQTYDELGVLIQAFLDQTFSNSTEFPRPTARVDWRFRPPGR